jgi:hypothetical protein
MKAIIKAEKEVSRIYKPLCIIDDSYVLWMLAREVSEIEREKVEGADMI